jgi:YD repeat-containing protein
MRTAAMLIVVVAVVCACARPNPRISKMTRAQGNNTLTTRFDYDDHGHPSDVSAEVGGGTDEIKFTWNGSQITKIETDHNRNFGGSAIDQTQVTYDNNQRLSKMTTDVGNATTNITVTFTYDDKNNLTTIENDSITDDKNKSLTTTTLSYDDKGLKTETIVLDFFLAGFESKTQTVNDITYGDDGRPSTFTSDPDSGKTSTIDISYDKSNGDRLTTFDETGGTIATNRYDYDDQGRMNAATLEQKGQNDVNVTIEYDDAGDVSDIDMTPNSIGLVQLFDLRGDGFTTIEPAQQAIRIGGLSW